MTALADPVLPPVDYGDRTVRIPLDNDFLTIYCRDGFMLRWDLESAPDDEQPKNILEAIEMIYPAHSDTQRMEILANLSASISDELKAIELEYHGGSQP